MGKALQSQLAILFILIGSLGYSQTSVRISDPRIEMVGNTIHIFYDILNSTPDENYIISVVIKDEDGHVINAKAIDGDIGEEVRGGSNKQITWDLEADNIYLDAYVFIQINASVIPPPVPELEELTKKDFESQDDSKESETDGAIKKEESSLANRTKSFSRAGIIIQSLALPGLGLSRVTGKPHWLRGVAGYGCLAGSIILNRQAINTYDNIEDLMYFDEINEAYDKSLQQDNISEILSYAAIGIWVADFVWTLIGTSDLNRNPYSAETDGFSIGSEIDPLSNIPLLSVRYRF